MKLLAAIGIVVLVTPALFGLVILMAMWMAWWIHPLWAVVLAPLGVPHVGFWHFVALVSFVRTVSHAKGLDDSVKETNSDKKLENVVGYFFGWLIGPPFVYAFIHWCMR